MYPPGRSLRTAGLISLALASGLSGYLNHGVAGAAWTMGILGAIALGLGLWMGNTPN